MWEIIYTKQALKDKEKLTAAKLDKKAKGLIDIMKENPFQIPPLYEKLTGNLAGIYSRRINLQHRLIYEVLDEPHGQYKGYIKIARMWTHYD